MSALMRLAFIPALLASSVAVPRAAVLRVAPAPRMMCTPLASADSVLKEYDANHRAAANSEGSEGLGGACTANEWASGVHHEPLVDAVCALRDAARGCDGRVMLGICADDAQAGVNGLKEWVSALELPRGLLHGMDKDGVALDMSTFGSVYVKYNSKGSNSDPPGTASLAGYKGDFRGVYFNVDLPDGEFRQYAVLPLDLFAKEGAAAPASAAPPPVAADPEQTALSLESAAAAIESLLPAMQDLGATCAIEGVDAAEGSVVVRYDGPPKLRRVIELVLRSDASAESIEFVGGAEEEADASGGSDAKATAVEPASPEPAPSPEPAVAAVPAVPERFTAAYRFESRSSWHGRGVEPRTSVHEELHSVGYVLLRPHDDVGLRVDDECLQAIRDAKYEPIFNGQPLEETPRRLMGSHYTWARDFEGRFAEALQEAGVLHCTDGSLKTVNDCYALRSLPSPEGEEEDDDLAIARAGRQPAHSDCPEPVEGSLAELADDDMPLSLMLAVQEGTRLWVFPKGCQASDAAVLVRIPVGAMLVWRGDLVHAGAGYDVDHVRVHAYVDPPAGVYFRPRGKTNRCAGGLTAAARAASEAAASGERD